MKRCRKWFSILLAAALALSLLTACSGAAALPVFPGTVSLSTLEPLNGGWPWNNIAPEDQFGNDYSSAVNYAVFNWNNRYDYWQGSENGYDVGYAEYRVYGRYDLITMTLAPYKTIREEGKSFVQVYADGKLVATSPVITRKSDPVSLEASIAGAEYIKIMVYNYIGGHIGDKNDSAFILSNARLWRG